MKSPFKFLDSYTKDDREIFFGRDREIEELYHRVFESKLMLVYGVSGTGKSSLIHCGLANKFSETDWLPLVVRRGGNIINSMEGAIQAASITRQDGQLSSPVQFRKSVKSLYLDHYKPVFFIFDQFEELFIFGDKEERKSFVQIIKSLIESDLQCRLIFVMREEYMAGVTEFEKYIPTFFSNRVRIEKMAHTNAIEAIIGPCKTAGISLEEGFPEALLERLSPEGADVELTYLQVFLDKVFRLGIGNYPPLGGGQGGVDFPKQDDQRIIFTISLLTQAGNVSDLLGSFLDEQISLLSDPDPALAVLKSFVSVKGTKRPMTSHEVKEYAHTLGKPIADPALLEMLQTFIHLRILRDKDQNDCYELRHDALAGKIFEKITMVEKELLEIRQLIENAYNSWLKRAVLLSAGDLQYIAPYESRLYLPEEYGKLIEKSKKELVKARHRRRNILMGAAVILIIVLGGFTLWALKEKKNAVEKERIANEAKIKATASEKEAISARDKAIESDLKAVASEKEALAARDIAKESELRIKKEKELAVIRERLTRANNLNFLSKEIVTKDPTIALRLAEVGLNLDSNNRAIPANMVKIYSENSFYKVFYDRSGTIGQVSPDWTKIIATNGRIARLTYLDGSKSQLLTGHLVNGFALDVHYLSRRGYDDITAIAFSPDGNSVLTGSKDKTAILWDLNGNKLQVFKGHVSWVNSVAFSPDGKSILTGSSDRYARIWDLNGKTLQVFGGHKFDIFSAAFSPDGQSILTGSADSTARLWDLKGKQIQIFRGHTGWVTKVAFSPDGKTVLTGSRDNTARTWDLEGRSLQTFSGHENYISFVAFSPDGRTVVTGSADKTARIWDLTGNTLQTLSGHEEEVNSVAFSPDGNKVITFSTDGISRIWDLTQNAFKSLEGHKEYVYRAIFSPDGKTILTLSLDQTARLWDLNGTCFRVIKMLANGVAFSADGKTILKGLIAAQLVDLNGEVLMTLSGHTQSISSLAFSPDGKTILTGSFDKTARLWDIDGKPVKVFSGHLDRISSVAFSPDGKTFITGSWDKTAILWDLNGKILQVFKGHLSGLNSVAFSPDGKTILTGGDMTARLWDINGKNLQIFSGHTEAVTSAAFSPDGKSIITGSLDKSARIWDLKGNTVQILSGQNGMIYSVEFSPDGKTVLTGSTDKTARLISVKMPLNRFLSENICEALSVEQQLKYEIIQADQLNKTKDTRKLYEGLWFYIAEARAQKEKKAEYSDYANMLYKKLQGSAGNILNRKWFISAGVDIYKLRPLKYISEGVEKANNLFLSSSAKEDVIEAYDFYSDKCSSLDSVKIAMKLPECLIQLSGKLLSLDTTLRHIISVDLSCLSWQLLQNRKFKTALEAITLANKADSANQYALTTFPVALVLNNRFDEAGKIYQKLYKNFMLNNITKSNKLFFLEDIADLENRGIVHPDFVRVKELLKQ